MNMEWMISRRDVFGPDNGATYWRIISPKGVVFECQQAEGYPEIEDLVTRMVKRLNNEGASPC